MARNVITYIKKHLYPILSTMVCGSLFVFLSLMSCQQHEGSEEQLKADIDSFATYYYNWHFEKAARFCTPESKVWLRYAASNVHQADIELLKAKNEDAQIEIGDIDFNEDEVTATVNLEITNFLQMDTIGKEARLIKLPYKNRFALPFLERQTYCKVKIEITAQLWMDDRPMFLF